MYGTTYSRPSPSSVRTTCYLGYPSRAPYVGGAVTPGGGLPFSVGHSISSSSPLYAPPLSLVSSVTSTSVSPRFSYSPFPSCPSPASPAFVNFTSLGASWQLSFPLPVSAYLCFIPAAGRMSSVYWNPFYKWTSLKKLGKGSARFFFYTVTTVSAVLGL